MPQLTRNPYTARTQVSTVEPYEGPKAPPVLEGAPGAPKGIAYLVGAAYIFFLFSHAVEFIDVTGRLHIMVLLAFGCALATLSAGTLPDAIKSKPGIMLTLFTIVIIFGLPFSAWKGGSFKSFMDIWWKSYLTFFLVSCLVFTVQQFRRTLFVIGCASAGILYFAHKAMKTYGDDRVSVEYGSLGNSNDLAGALLICLPIVVYIVMDKRRAAAIRLAFLAMAGFLMVTVVKTGSRASLLVVALMAVIVFIRASVGKKAVLIAVCALGVGVFPFFVTNDLIVRYKTMFVSEAKEGMSETATSAIESTQARKQLIRNAIWLTIHRPIFGVGLGNFAFSSNNLEIARGNPPLWYTCHNIYLLVSSETGVPCFFFFVATIIYTGKILRRIERASKLVPELAEVVPMAFALSLSLIVYAACGVFNTNSYTMQLPALAGLAVALDRITRSKLATAEEQRFSQFRAATSGAPNRFAHLTAGSLSS